MTTTIQGYCEHPSVFHFEIKEGLLCIECYRRVEEEKKKAREGKVLPLKVWRQPRWSQS